MIVSELIEKLNHFDGNMRVVQLGYYQNGLVDTSDVKVTQVVFDDESEPDFYDRHQEDEEGKHNNSVPAVFIG